MAFHIRNGRRISRELRRLASKEFSAALRHLDQPDPDEEAIHEARKSLKKIRAILRLGATELGAEYCEQDEQLRTAAHALAALRDADVTPATVETLHGRYQKVITARTAKTMADKMRSRSRDIRARAPYLLNRAAPILRRLEKSTPARIDDAVKFNAVRKAASDGYRRARKAMDGLALEAAPDQFHRFRRRVKNHWYQMRLFELIHSTPRRRASRVRALDTWLGDDHNLAILKAALLEDGPDIAAAETTARVLGCIDKRQATLRRRALEAGHRLFRRTPKEFDRSFRRWWRGRT